MCVSYSNNVIMLYELKSVLRLMLEERESWTLISFWIQAISLMQWIPII